MAITTTINGTQLVLRKQIFFYKELLVNQTIELFFKTEEELVDVFKTKDLDDSEGCECLWNRCILSMNTDKYLRKFKTQRWYMQYSEVDWNETPLIKITDKDIIVYNEMNVFDIYQEDPSNVIGNCREKLVEVIIDPIIPIITDNDMVLRKSIARWFTLDPLEVFIDSWKMFPYHQNKNKTVLEVIFSIITNQRN